MRLSIAEMALVFCPFPHAELPEHQRHCTHMVIVLANGTTEVWHDPPREFYLNVYDGVVPKKVARACPQHAWRESHSG